LAANLAAASTAVVVWARRIGPSLRRGRQRKKVEPKIAGSEK
jgi:hypothetical protein